MEFQVPRRLRPSLAVALLITFASATSPAGAHPGGLDSNGCHTNHKTGEYHCHRAQNAPSSPGIVKKSRSGICHDPSSPWYDQTANYIEFKTLDECLASGGRLPKR